ncbi:MAG: glycoside hydrolase family 71/99-like protein [Armatimonadota bacterium]
MINRIHMGICLAVVMTAIISITGYTSAETQGDAVKVETYDEAVIRTMKPYRGPVSKNINNKTLTGKVMCGYQGWFSAEGDGTHMGWSHVGGSNGFKPGSSGIDFWPDMTEMSKDERYPTEFRHTDGSVADMFSSYNRKTILRHFKWMRDYGIDGVYLQRFAVISYSAPYQDHYNTVMRNCIEGASRYGRTIVLMYDLSGLTPDHVEDIKKDWRNLVDRMELTKSKAYQHHNGKPVIGLWGLGFNDKRAYTPTDVLNLVRFFKDDPKYGGCTVFLGVPTYWRTLDGDCLNDPVVHEAIRVADIVSPWTVGRFGTIEDAKKYASERMVEDIKWCKKNGKEYTPVLFPGFSWHNMFPDSPSAVIPRLGGRFLWSQYIGAKKAGATMIYQAMFDEVNEGTAIFKCTNDVPVGESKFVTYEGLPSDYYLNLVGMGGRLIRGEIPVTDELPKYSPRKP